jgi:hypothetical protein
LSLNTTTGVISGTPTTAGSSSVDVTATNAIGTSTAATLSFTIAPEPTVWTVTVTPSTSSILRNQTQQFSASAVDQHGNPYNGTFTWSTTSGTISSSGLFTGTTAGTNIGVTATASGFSGTAHIDVLTLTITVTPSGTSILKDETKQFSASAVDQNGNPYSTTFTWSASSGSVNSSGLFTGSVAGSNITVTATSNGYSGSATITVLTLNIAVTPSNAATILVGHTSQFSASATDQFGNPYSTTFTWSASSGTINSSGLFTGTTAGTGIVITAAAQGYSGTATIDVTAGTIITASIGSNTFSWTLDKTVTHGTFVDGQPWFIVPAEGVNLIAATPARLNHQLLPRDITVNKVLLSVVDTADINITVINPPIGTYYNNNSGAIITANGFGWDGRGAIRYGVGLLGAIKYNGGNNFNAAIGWDGSTPVPLSVGDIITTAKSITTRVPDLSDTDLDAVAVLTALSATPPADAFRPGVQRSATRRTNPEFIRKSDIINLSSSLIPIPATTLAGGAVPTTPPTTFAPSYLTNIFQGPSILTGGLNNARSFNAYYNNNISGQGYGQDVSRVLGDLSVGCIANWLTASQRDSCQIHFIQRAIDTYESLLAGLVLAHNGGHLPGYGALLTVAGKMLNHSGMLGMNDLINGREPIYFLSDYSQMVYIEEYPITEPNTPPSNSPRRANIFTPIEMYQATPTVVSATNGTTTGTFTVSNSYGWASYRAAREVQNLKIRVESGTGAGSQFYVVTDITGYVDKNGVAGTAATDPIYGGTLTVKPAWQNGTPDATSVIKTYAVLPSETPCWAFKSGGLNSSTGTYIPHFTLSPYTDYGTINIGAYLTYLCTMYKLGAESYYKSGMDKWIIQMAAQPGYGEVSYSDGNARAIANPATSNVDGKWVSGMWKEQVLNKVGVTFVYTDKTTNSLLAPTDILPTPFDLYVNVNKLVAPKSDFRIIKTSNELTVELSAAYNALTIISVDGKIVFQSKLNHSTQNFLIHNLSRGCYIAQIESEGKTLTKKFVF